MEVSAAEPRFRRVLLLRRLISSAVWSLMRWVFIVGISYVILFPVLSKLSSSLMAERDLYDQTVLWVPRNFTLEHFRIVFRCMQYPVALFNSLKLALLVAILQVASCTIIGYGLARFKAAGGGLLSGLVLFTLVVPPQVIMIPSYINFRFFDIFGLIPGGGINLLGTYWPAILMSATGLGFKNGLFIFIMRQFYRGMPVALEEAAYVDGAGPFTAFFRIMLPSSKPVMTVVFLFALVWQWNDSLFTHTFMRSSNLLTTNLLNLVQVVFTELGIEMIYRKGGYASIIQNTGALLFIAPLLIVYAVVQRNFVEGIERTGIIG